VSPLQTTETAAEAAARRARIADLLRELARQTGELQHHAGNAICAIGYNPATLNTLADSMACYHLRQAAQALLSLASLLSPAGAIAEPQAPVDAKPQKEGRQ
jgi:hypothetical protein